VIKKCFITKIQIYGYLAGRQIRYWWTWLQASSLHTLIPEV